MTVWAHFRSNIIMQGVCRMCPLLVSRSASHTFEPLTIQLVASLPWICSTIVYSITLATYWDLHSLTLASLAMHSPANQSALTSTGLHPVSANKKNDKIPHHSPSNTHAGGHAPCANTNAILLLVVPPDPKAFTKKAHKTVNTKGNRGKRQNLLVTLNGRLKITDFGFARIAAWGADEVNRLTFCGRDHYMSPEILLREESDLPTNVCSLSVIFCEILARKLADDVTFKVG